MTRITELEILYGLEPEYPNSVVQPNYSITLAKSLNWYGKVKSNADKKKWLNSWAKSQGIDGVNLIPDEYTPTLGAVARMIELNFKFHKNHIDYLTMRTKLLIEKYKLVKIEKDKPKGLLPSQINSISKKIGGLYDIFDPIIDNILIGKSRRPRIPEYVCTLNVTQINEVQTDYRNQLIEIEHVLNNQEEYTQYYPQPRLRIKNVSRFLRSIITSLDEQKINIQVRRAKTPRKKKVVAASKLVSKLKYMNADAKYGIISVQPEKIIKSQVVIFFNVKTRLLSVYIANNQDGLSVKGASITNFNETDSYAKLLRKPDDTLKLILTSPKIRLLKLINELKTAPKKVSGRVLKEMVILKVFK